MNIHKAVENGLWIQFLKLKNGECIYSTDKNFAKKEKEWINKKGIYKNATMIYKKVN